MGQVNLMEGHFASVQLIPITLDPLKTTSTNEVLVNLTELKLHELNSHSTNLQEVKITSLKLELLNLQFSNILLDSSIPSNFKAENCVL
jgi:hypothetical protein